MDEKAEKEKETPEKTIIPEVPEEGAKGEDKTPSVEEQLKELEKKVKLSEEDKEGMKQQLIKLRTKNQELSSQLEGKKPDEKPEEGEDETEAKVRKVLAEDKEEQRKTNRVEALHKFWKKHPEYHPETDISGMLMGMVNQTLKRLNTEKSVSVSAILKDYEDSLRLMKKEEPDKTKVEIDASTIITPGTPKTTPEGKLNLQEEKLRKQLGWTLEKFIRIRDKHPQIITKNLERYGIK